MSKKLGNVLLRPGDSVSFSDRDDLLATLDELDQQVPGRDAGRSKDHREHFCMLRYLRFLAAEDLLVPRLTLRKPPEGQDPPDFILEWADGRNETFELTDGSTEEYQRALTKADRKGDQGLTLPKGVDFATPDAEASELWAEILFSAFLEKATGLVQGRYQINHLLIYDLTGLGLLLPLARGAPLLRRRIDDWHRDLRPDHRFQRISVLRDLALLLDLTGEARLLQSESPYFRLPVIRAANEEDLRRRLRELDRYCREHSIRHLKLFGSILGDRLQPETESPGSHHFAENSDLDLLVDFEPDTRVTLLDMARMERELGELIGFKVDLLTAEDLSRYFRKKVVRDAVELHGSRA